MRRRAAIATLVGTGLLALLPASALAATSDLAVDATDSVDPATKGTEFTYAVAVSNSGPDTANGVELIDTVPSQVDVVASTPSQGSCKLGGRKLTCSFGAIADGAVATVAVRVVPKKAGLLVNTATVSTTDADPVVANDTDTEQTTVVEPPPAPRCAGQEATIVGTEGADQLTGTAKKDVFVALGGDDVILGLGGDDLVCAGRGDDTVKGAAGNDEIRTAGGDDRLKGGNGRDLLRGGGGSDRLRGGAGADSLRGGAGPDHCKGGPGHDTKRGC